MQEDCVDSGRKSRYNSNKSASTRAQNGNGRRFAAMLIRELRDDELYKSAKLSALAFSYAVNIEEKKKETLKEHTFGAFLDDNETLIAQVVAIDYVSFHNGTPVGAVGIAGVASSRRGSRHFRPPVFHRRRAGLGAELSVPVFLPLLPKVRLRARRAQPHADRGAAGARRHPAEQRRGSFGIGRQPARTAGAL